MTKYEEFADQVKILNEQSFSDADISRQLHISESSVRSIRVTLGLPVRNRTHITDNEVRKGVQDGLSYAAIARKYCTSETQVRRRVEKLQLTVTNEIKQFEQKIKTLVEQGLNVQEICKILDISRRDRVWSTIKRLGLFDQFYKQNYKITHIRQVDLKQFKLKHEEGLTDTELSEFFQLSVATVKNYRKKLKLPINTQYRILNIDEFTEEEFQVLYGTILGDTHLSHRSTNVNGSMAHCIKQKAFIDYKHQKLCRFVTEVREVVKIDKRFKNSEYHTYQMYIKASKALNKLYSKTYKNKIKYVDKELLYRLTGLGIATWYMDDGSNCHYGYIFCTHGFSKADVCLIQQFFKEKYDINTTIRKDNVVYIKADSKQKFKDLVSPYIIPSMQYKL